MWAFFILVAGSPLALPGELTPQLDYHPALHGAEFFVSLYEEVGDLDDTPAIQRALDAAKAAGGGTVVLHNRAYFVSYTLEIGSHGSGNVGGISLVGQGFVVSSVTNASILVDTGSVGHGPILRVHNAHSIRLGGFGFDGNNKATSCLHLEHDQTDTTPASWPVEHVDCHAVTFLGARDYNLQINDHTTAGMIWGDVSMVSLVNCYFRPSQTAAATKAHIFQRSPNALSNNCHGVQFFGNGTYPEHAVEMESGSMTFFGCQSVLLGDVDVEMVAAGNDTPPSIIVDGWESQSANFLHYDSTGSTANAVRASVLSGVTHLDISAGTVGTYTIWWETDTTAGAWGPLVLNGIAAQYDIKLDAGTGIHPAVFVEGVSFQDNGAKFTGTGVANIQHGGSWRENATPKGRTVRGDWVQPHTVDPTLISTSQVAPAADRAVWWRVKDGGKVSKIRVHATVTGGNAAAAIYRNNGLDGESAAPTGAPIAKVAYTTVTSGVMDFALDAAVYVYPGDWFAFVCSGTTASFAAGPVQTLSTSDLAKGLTGWKNSVDPSAWPTTPVLNWAFQTNWAMNGIA